MDIKLNLERRGALLTGQHFFVLKSAKVATMYVNSDPLFTDPRFLEFLGGALITPFTDTCEAIVGPAAGGIPLIYAAERYLHFKSITEKMDSEASERAVISTAWADKKPDGTFEFERMGFKKAVAGKRVVVVEDVTTTGDSMGVTADLVREAGGIIIGATCIWNRGDVTAEALGVPEFHALVSEKIPSWYAGEHPEWGRWPIVSDVGHPERYPNYPGGMVSVLS